ncbi:hypothetical protein CPB84DRAFT_1844115 [Gymnopilus junonius]|uniref:ER-bound oxygenase mpaB/mpaB'/Rubber oxygenase catalytic domain-containing protein n=1 Tax=Gymnopilus junonius TaxID=109634 RepID=A0A9P5TRA9_GYMJU|nr:hypothetical protein CPB84DRAFT_1844115 [Gymnopilus junonius]
MDILLDILHYLIQRLPRQNDIIKHLGSVPALAYVAGGVIGWMTLWDNGRGSLTAEEAQKVILSPTMYDMPLLLNYAVAFALFKTYAIPSISKLLCQTNELKAKDTVSKRYADTELLIATVAGCPISGFTDPSFHMSNTGPNQKPAEDPRGTLALARINYLHSKYKISNGDFLYTLCLFALEPDTWVNRYGWRKLSPLERHAYYVFWAEFGRRMGIVGIPENFEALRERSMRECTWSRLIQIMIWLEVPSTSFSLLYPRFSGLKAFAGKIAISLLDDNVREAMMYPKQPWLLETFTGGLLVTVNLFQLYFMLSHSNDSWFFPVDIRLPKIDKKASCPRLYPTKWAARPWYRPESTSMLGYLRDKSLVTINYYTEMPGPHLKSSGYRIEEMASFSSLGPSRYENSGHDEVNREAAKMLGCPVTGPWSVEGRKVTA